MLRRILKRLVYPPHLRRTGTIALSVGTWLTIVNQGDLLLEGTLMGRVWVKVLLNFLTPLVVANLGLLSAEHRTQADS